MSLPLEGVRVLDLTWVIAGPVCTRMLADQGAEVIKVESFATMDPIRMSGQWLHGVNTAPDGGATFTHYNRNKRSATLNLKTPRGRELLLELAKKSDAIVNNYSAGVMERLGLGCEVLRELNPRLVVAELSGMGQTGPYRSHVAFGMTLMALSGAYELTGYPDGTPFMPGYTFTDFAAAAMGAFAIIAALRHRDRTGEGQYLDLGQFQMGAALFAEEQFEYLVTGKKRTREGNREEGALVHGVYRCLGADDWCTIAARTDEEWGTLVRLGVIPGWMDRDRRAGAFDPSSQSADVDAAVEAWTLGRDALEVMLELQREGIDAARVQTAAHLVRDDAQLAAREWFQTFTHLSGEEVGIDGMPFRMSETQRAHHTGGPI
jgi:crotonobetainyl-CoA:carnitine CoA-transferase CaiB-like acyl-CoA transferase